MKAVLQVMSMNPAKEGRGGWEGRKSGRHGFILMAAMIPRRNPESVGLRCYSFFSLRFIKHKHPVIINAG